jgi:hypothetical protein
MLDTFRISELIISKAQLLCQIFDHLFNFLLFGVILC